MCVNCVVSVTTFALPVIVGGVGVLQARIRRSNDSPAPGAAADADHAGTPPETPGGA
jgi:hypothetical protein